MIAAYSNSTSAPQLGAMVLDINTSTKAISLNTEYTFTHGFQLDEISMARLSATKFMFVTRVGKAQILNVAGTVVTAGPIGSISTFSTFGATRLIPISSTTALYTYGNGSDILARVLTIDGSDNVTEGSPVTMATSTGAGISVYDSALFTTSKGVVVFQDDASANFYLMGQLVSISGTTLTLDGSKQTLYNTNQGWNSSCAAAELSSTEIVTAHNVTTGGGFPEKLACHVISLSGSTLSAGATLDIAGADFIEPFRTTFTNSATILLSGGSAATNRVTQLTKSGTTLNHTASDFVDITVNTRIVFDSIHKIADDFALCCTLGSKDGTVIGSDSAPASDTGTYVIGTAIDNETAGTTAWLTAWRDGTLYLQRWGLPGLSKDLEISLGAATLAQVQAKTKIAYPYAGSDQTMWVFGNMDSPAFVTGTVHLVETTGAGASGTWTISPDLSSWASTDVLDSLIVTPDLDGIGTREFIAVRRRTGTAPELWQGLNALSLKSTIPLPTGTGVEYRGMHMGRNQSIALGTDTLGTGSSRILSSITPYTGTWTDITYDYPSGTVQVLRYL
jgi:hypothetical protein